MVELKTNEISELQGVGPATVTEFPSLKGKEKYFKETWTDEYYNANDIISFCIDKQTIREAIEKYSGGECGLEPIGDAIYKELKL